MIEKNCCIIYLKNSFISLFKRFLFLYIVIQWESIIKWNKPLFHQPAKVHSFYNHWKSSWDFTFTRKHCIEVKTKSTSSYNVKCQMSKICLDRYLWGSFRWICNFICPQLQTCIQKIIKLKLHHFSWEELDTVNPPLSPPLIPCMFECGVGGGGLDSIERECFFIFSETQCFSAF